ncbi:hypothetical protein S58_01410 [Bradyrhizobium oligotrophicum S58]|uniref:Uncharacterized protein n=1 Tax=Bradyrhizobium oligotrophicum S58 TaxID=1245469 RepID=M4Z0W9_9BRAD|nr:hypothetical protein S58_01410 [Bradyrhizobium oligotrophicum S58]
MLARKPRMIRTLEMSTSCDARSVHPSLEGEGRLTESEAKREAGWGDLSTSTDLPGEITPPRSTVSRAIAPPLQEKVGARGSLHAP